MKNDSLVTTYDFDTRTKSTIPAAELAPGMIRVEVDGVGLVYVRAEQVQSSKTRKELPDGFVPIARATLDLLRPRMTWIKSEEDWLDGFRADRSPVRELMIWMWATVVYHKFAHEGKDSEAIAQHVFRMVTSGMYDGAHPLETVQLTELSNARVKAIVAGYNSAMSDNEFVAFWDGRVDLNALNRLRAAETERQ